MPASLHRLGIPVHGGQRREAKPFHGLPEVERGLDLHDHALGALHDEAVGAGDARTVEQCVDGDGFRLRRGGRKPEPDEVRKFLGRTAAGAERNPSRGHADLAKLAFAAEIGSAQERDPGLGLTPVRSTGLRLAHPEARHGRRACGQLCRDVSGRNIEIAGIVEDFAGNVLAPAPLHGVHAHGLGEILAHMHEGDRIRARITVAEQRQVRLVMKLAMRVVIDGGDDLGVRARRRAVSGSRKRLRVRLQPVVGKRLRFAHAQAGRAGARGKYGKGLCGERKLEKATAVDHDPSCTAITQIRCHLSPCRRGERAGPG